jgi:hypothetical protein
MFRMFTVISAALVLSVLERVASLQTIYLIRHCDKVYDGDSNSDANPCCSDLGYDRANGWPYFFNRLYDADKQVYLYSTLADYHAEGLCKPNLVFNLDKECQRSQRMTMTSLLIHYNLNSDVNLELNYCTNGKFH